MEREPSGEQEAVEKENLVNILLVKCLLNWWSDSLHSWILLLHMAFSY